MASRWHLENWLDHDPGCDADPGGSGRGHCTCSQAQRSEAAQHPILQTARGLCADDVVPAPGETQERP